MDFLDTASQSSTGRNAPAVAKVLDPFAAGEPTPGSGSANALTAAVAAALITSVAKKTMHRQEPRYRPIQQLSTDIAARSEKLRTELTELIEQDALAFAPVIAHRLATAGLIEEYRQDQSRRREIAFLKPATEIPIRIVEIAISIGTMAISMLEQGFQGAKGESYSALTGAIAAADGSLCVARLNVQAVQQRVKTLNDPKLEAFWLRSILTRIHALRVASRPLRIRETRFRRELQRSSQQPSRKQRVRVKR
jgi:formiminotetrahydrofolate cyclodeaminase